MTYLRNLLALMFIVLGAIFSVQAQDIDNLRDKAFNGDSKAMLELAKIYKNQGDYEKYSGWLKKAAQEGNEEAIYLYTETERKNLKDSVEYFRRVYTLAESGNVYSMLCLAELYETGNGVVSKDINEALSWYNKIVEINEKTSTIYAIMHIANIYAMNDSINEAIEWYNKAIDMGESEESVINVMSGKVLREFAQRGNVSAILRLASFYESRGDLYRAEFFYKKAAEKGNEEAQIKYDRIIHMRYNNRQVQANEEQANEEQEAEMRRYSALEGVWYRYTNHRVKAFRITLYPSSGSVKFELWVGRGGLQWVEYSDAHYVSPGQIYVNGGADFGKVTFRLSGNTLVGTNGRTYYK